MKKSPPRRGVSTAEAPLRELMTRRRGPLFRFLVRRPRLRTGLILGFLAVQAAVSWITSAGHESVTPVFAATSVALQALSILALVWRDTYPLQVFLFILGCDIGQSALIVLFFSRDFGAGTVAGFFALYSVAKWCSARTTRLAALGQLTLSLVFLGALSIGEQDFWIYLLLGFFILAPAEAAVILLGLGAKRERLHQEEIEAWAAAQAVTAQLEERARIAREMHDVVAHSLTVMIALADGARIVNRKSPERGSEAMAEVSSTGRAALADMRRVLGVLKSESAEAPLSPLPAMDALRDLIEGFKKAGVPVTLVQSGGQWPKDPAFLQTVFRIVQESLTNVLRYARSASQVTVELASRPECLSVAVTDNSLPGGEAEPRRRFPGTGNGLNGLQTRVEAFGGEFSAGPRPPQGWQVLARFPPAALDDPRTQRTGQGARP